jgi:hypothetical protein
MAGSVALFQRNWLHRDYLNPIETALFYWLFSMFPSPCILSCTHEMVLYVHINHIHPFYLELYGPVQNARNAPIICTTYWIDQQTNILFAMPTAICPHIPPPGWWFQVLLPKKLRWSFDPIIHNYTIYSQYCLSYIFRDLDTTNLRRSQRINATRSPTHAILRGAAVAWRPRKQCPECNRG